MRYEQARAADVLVAFQGLLGCTIYVEEDAKPALLRSTLSLSTRSPLTTRALREALDRKLIEDDLVLREGDGFFVVEKR